MLRRKQLLWAVMSLVVITSPSVWALDAMGKEISGEVTADYFGKYVWRGQVLTNGYVFQPGVSINCPEDKLTVGVWGNVDQSKVNGERGEFTEVDTYLDYTDALPGMDGVSYSAGLIYYAFPLPSTSAVRDTSEIYGGLAFENCPLSPTATLYFDIDEASGFYANLGVSHSLEISELGMGVEDMADSVAEGMLSTIDLSASLGAGDDDYNAHYWTSATASAPAALNDLVISLAIPVQVCEHATLTGSVNYVKLVDGSVHKYRYTSERDIVYGGVGLSMPF